MQRLCALLIDEVSEWPQVSSKPMFGFVSFYRGDTIFAAIPKSRALHTANSIIFKLPPGSKHRSKTTGDPQVLTEFTAGAFANWFPLEIADESALRGAMGWLERAYETAGKDGRPEGRSGVRKHRAQ
jgi:hypothetical protein